MRIVLAVEMFTKLQDFEKPHTRIVLAVEMVTKLQDFEITHKGNGLWKEL